LLKLSFILGPLHERIFLITIIKNSVELWANINAVVGAQSNINIF